MIKKIFIGLVFLSTFNVAFGCRSGCLTRVYDYLCGPDPKLFTPNNPRGMLLIKERVHDHMTSLIRQIRLTSSIFIFDVYGCAIDQVTKKPYRPIWDLYQTLKDNIRIAFICADNTIPQATIFDDLRNAGYTKYETLYTKPIDPNQKQPTTDNPGKIAPWEIRPFMHSLSVRKENGFIFGMFVGTGTTALRFVLPKMDENEDDAKDE